MDLLPEPVVGARLNCGRRRGGRAEGGPKGDGRRMEEAGREGEGRRGTERGKERSRVAPKGKEVIRDDDAPLVPRLSAKPAALL